MPFFVNIIKVTLYEEKGYIVRQLDSGFFSVSLIELAQSLWMRIDLKNSTKTISHMFKSI